MKCNNCGNEVFDIFTTEDRIKSLYQSNNTASWCKNRISTLIDMLDKDQEHIQFPPTIEWIRNQLIEIRNGIKVTS